MWRRLLVATVAAGIGAAALLVYSRMAPDADASDPELVALGRAVYARQCASCHGAELEGQPAWRERRPDGRLPAPPHNKEGHTWHHSDRQLFTITKEGVSGVVPGYQSDMPAYRDILSDREIWSVLAYIKSTWPPDIRDRQPRSETNR